MQISTLEIYTRRRSIWSLSQFIMLAAPNNLGWNPSVRSRSADNVNPVKYTLLRLLLSNFLLSHVKRVEPINRLSQTTRTAKKMPFRRGLISKNFVSPKTPMGFMHGKLSQSKSRITFWTTSDGSKISVANVNKMGVYRNRMMRLYFQYINQV